MASRPLIHLYYDVISPYAWLGFEGLLRYQKTFPIDIDLKPFFLRNVMMTSGNCPPSFVPNKGQYAVDDLERNAQYYNVDIRPRQLAKSGTLVPKEANWLPDAKKTTEKALKIVLSVQKSEPENLIAVSRAFWSRLWAESKPIFTENDFYEVLQCSSNASFHIKQAKTEEIAKLLKENTATALDSECFGAPWFVVHHKGKRESFFGADRFHLIAQLLNHHEFSYDQLKN